MNSKQHLAVGLLIAGCSMAFLLPRGAAQQAAPKGTKQVSKAATAKASSTGAAAVTTGEFLVDPPTLINLGFEWTIEGDSNRNAAVEVSYRKKGEAQWHSALPLLRLQNEEIYQGDRLHLISPNMFAGSILDLEPGTEYEARFVMSDPDGVRGQAERTVTV